MGYLTQRFMKHDGKTVQEWITGFNGSEDQKTLSLQALTGIGAVAVPEFQRALLQGTDAECEGCLRVLGKLNLAAMPALVGMVTALYDPLPSIRKAASDTLSNLVTHIPESRVEIADEVAKQLLALDDDVDPAGRGQLDHMLTKCASFDEAIAEAVRAVRGGMGAARSALETPAGA